MECFGATKGQFMLMASGNLIQSKFFALITLRNWRVNQQRVNGIKVTFVLRKLRNLLFVIPGAPFTYTD